MPAIAAPESTLTAPARTLRAVIYCRISRDKVGAGLGVKRQEGDCRKLAERLAAQLGVTIAVVAVLCDNDVSAYSGRKRKDYARLMSMIANGETDIVLTWHGDRLHRSVRELEDYIDASNERDISTHTVTAGDYDLSTSNGRFQARLAGVIARRESEHRSERVRAASAQRAATGGINGGPRAFGWNADGKTLHPAEADEIRKAYKTILSGGSMRSIAADWNARGVRTSFGKEWVISGVRDMFLRPRNAGIRIYQGTESAADSPIEAIVNEADFRAVHAMLSDPSRKNAPGNQPKHLGTGIFACVCGQPVRAGTNGGHRGGPRYRCEGGPGQHVARDIALVDKHVTARVLDRLSREDAVDLLVEGSGEDAAALLAEKAVCQRKLDGLAVALATDALTLDQVTSATAIIRKQIAEFDQRIAAAAVADPLAAIVGAPNVAERWNSFDADTRRAIVRELIDVKLVSIKMGRRRKGVEPDPGVKIAWKRGAQGVAD